MGPAVPTIHAANDAVSRHYRCARSQLQEGWTITSMGPSDFHLFGHLKKHAAGQLFATDANVNQAVASWLQTHDTHFLGRVYIGIVNGLVTCTTNFQDSY